jgi:hypothetical protein
MPDSAQNRVTDPTGAACPISPPDGSSRGACDARLYRLPEFTVKFFVLAAVLVAAWLALWPISNPAARCVSAAIGLTYLFGCPRTRRSVLVMLPALYLPQLWVVWIGDYPWCDYRWHWVKMFWLLPGLIVEFYTGHAARTESWQFVWMAVFAITIWLVVVTLGRRGGRWLWVTGGLTFLLSCVAARIAEALFRA